MKNSKEKRKICSKNHGAKTSKDYLEKMKENDKIFEEKMSTLKQRKIKVIKSSNKDRKGNHSKEQRENHHKSKNQKNHSTKRENQINLTNVNKRKKLAIVNGQQITVLNCYPNNYINYLNKLLDFQIDNVISFNYLSKNFRNYSEEEQDIYFISKIRELQKDIKYKTDLIIDLQSKLKEKDDNFIVDTKKEMEELRNQIKNLAKEKEQRLREIQRLETENYNSKVVIDNYEKQFKNIKDTSEIKKDEIENLNLIIDKLRDEDELNKEKIKRLEMGNKSVINDYDSLRNDLNKVNSEKKKLEKIIEEQKLKMENYKKHINTLRKYICEDDGNKLSSRIDENNKIISSNNDDIENKRNRTMIQNKSLNNLLYKKINLDQNDDDDYDQYNNNEEENDNEVEENYVVENKNKKVSNKKVSNKKPTNPKVSNKKVPNKKDNNNNNKSSRVISRKNTEKSLSKNKNVKFKEEKKNEEPKEKKINKDNNNSDNKSRQKKLKDIQKNIIENSRDMEDNIDTITNYQYNKRHHSRSGSDLSERITKELLINPNVDLNNLSTNFKNRSVDKRKHRTLNRSKSRNLNSSINRGDIDNRKKEQTSTYLRNRINRNIDMGDFDDDNNDRFYQTYSNFNDIYLSNLAKREMEDDYRNNSENDITCFPSERYLHYRKEEINNLECQLDLLLMEKNNLENEMLKLPEHPKSLKEIKIKRALNDKLTANELNINNIRIKIRKIKEY